MTSREPVRSGAASWVRRYLPLEIAGTVTMLLAAQVAHGVTGSLAVSAIAGAAGENLGYYGVAAARSWTSWLTAVRPAGRWRRRWLALGYVLRGLMIEFGPSEVAYVVVHPVLLYVMPSVLGDTLGGWLVGKLLADVLFYGIAALSYKRFHRLIEPGGETA